MSRAVLRFDGGARPTNPGHAGFACVVELDGKTYLLSRYLGIKTNNQAEFIGCIVGIKYAKELGAGSLLVLSDSQIVVNLVRGTWKAKDEQMKQYARDARKLLDDLFGLGMWRIKWKRRSNNSLADGHCTSAIFWGMNQNPWTPQKIKDKRVGVVVDPFGQSDSHTPTTLKHREK